MNVCECWGSPACGGYRSAGDDVDDYYGDGDGDGGGDGDDHLYRVEDPSVNLSIGYNNY